MGTHIFPSEATVIIGAASALSSTAANKTMTTLLSNFSLSGAGSDLESVPLFGGAFVSQEKPREPVEMSFDFVSTYADATLFAQLLMSSLTDGSTLAESKNEPTDKVIYVQTFDGSTYKTIALNNARCISVDFELPADGYMTGSVSFKATPATADSTPKSNLKVAKAAASTITWA
jgi:hypothetical protein